MMSALKFCCPKTGEEIDPGIEDVDPAAAALCFSALFVRIDEVALTEAA